MSRTGLRPPIFTKASAALLRVVRSSLPIARVRAGSALRSIAASASLAEDRTSLFLAPSMGMSFSMITSDALGFLAQMSAPRLLIRSSGLDKRLKRTRSGTGS